MQQLLTTELRLGDVISVSVARSEFDDCIVTRITDTEIHLFRVYATCSDFSYTGGVIPYIGVEQFTIPRREPGWDHFVIVHSRKDIK